MVKLQYRKIVTVPFTKICVAVNIYIYMVISMISKCGNGINQITSTIYVANFPRIMHIFMYGTRLSNSIISIQRRTCM